MRFAITIFLFGLVCAPAQDLSEIFASASRQTTRDAKVTGLRFRCVPADCRVRPFESIVVQVLVDGEFPSKDGGDPKKGRIRRTPGLLKAGSGNGWVSKPFKFQGDDPEAFVEPDGGGFGSIFKKIAGDFTIQDAFLYTAPEKPGEYNLESDTEGVKGQVKVTVAADAASALKPEEVAFGSEDKSGEKYRALVEHYAPMLAQETWFQPKSDYAARFDFDNDLNGDNNWDNLEKGSSQAYVYYAVMETATHWFLIYNVFHPRDYSDKCVAGSCHENDNEGLIVSVTKDGSEFGKLLAVETLAHNNVYTYTNESALRAGAHSIDGRVELFEKTHPIVFIESGGHGIYSATHQGHARYDVGKDEFVSGTGITYVYKGAAERPKHANDRKVGYELLPILTHWWSRTTNDSNQRMFDEFAAYQPLGGRAGVKFARIGTTFLGRKESSNKAKPFWGWHDTRTLKQKILSPGQWGLDPAYSLSKNVRIPADMKYSLDYTYNPYLGIGEESVAVAASTATVVASTPTVITAGTATVSAPGAATSVTGFMTPVEASEGAVDFEARVDGSVVFQISGQEATPETLSGQPVANPKIQFSGPLPATATFTVEKQSGRGSVRIEQQPSAANGNVLKVRVDDPKGGAGDYRFRVRWKK